MALVINFTPPAAKRDLDTPDEALAPKMYSVEVTAHSSSHLEFTAHGVKSDAKSLYQIAAELEKIASIIRSDVITKVN